MRLNLKALITCDVDHFGFFVVNSILCELYMNYTTQLISICRHLHMYYCEVHQKEYDYGEQLL